VIGVSQDVFRQARDQFREKRSRGLDARREASAPGEEQREMSAWSDTDCDRLAGHDDALRSVQALKHLGAHALGERIDEGGGFRRS
jgi:hypothetical protein